MSTMSKQSAWTRPAVGDVSRETVWRIRVVRVLRGMTREQLDEAAGVSKGQTSSIESGRRGRWLTVDLAVAYAIALRVDVGWLLTGKPPRPAWKAPPGYRQAEEMCRADPRL